MGAIHSTKISANFGPKLNESVRSNRKIFEKTGPPFEVDHFSRLDRLEFWLNGSRPLISTSMATYHFINYSVRMLSVESFDTNKTCILSIFYYTLHTSPCVIMKTFCFKFLVFVQFFLSAFSSCLPLPLTRTLRVLCPLCSFSVFLALCAHFCRLASLAYWSLFVKNKRTSSVYTVFSLSGGNR